MNPVIDTVSGRMTVQEAVEWFSLDPIIERYGVWCVTTYGMECLYTEYAIDVDRLDEPDLDAHLRQKRWVNVDDMRRCLDAARRYHGVVVDETVPMEVEA